jgi:nucleoside-diphosphate-sugar epimerase
MKKIAVIGGSGFLGTRLVERLKASLKTYKIFDIENINKDKHFAYLDVEDKISLDKLDSYETIINLAAVHRDDIRPLSRYDDVNVQGAVNVCNAARKYNIKEIIFTSSVAIYGFAPPNTDESGDANFFNDYGRTKHLAENVYKKWYDEDPDNRNLVIIRPTVIFGEGNRGNVYNLLNQIASKRFVMFGNGKNRKSMAYVENVAAFIEHCLNNNSGLAIFNYIDKPDFNMNTLISFARKVLFGKQDVGFRLPAFIGLFIGYIADVIRFLTRIDLPISSIRVKKFMGTTQFNSSISKTDFIAPCSLEEGLEKTIRYEFIEDNSNNRTFDTE